MELNCASDLTLRLNQIFIACLFKGSQEQSFFLQTLLFTAFLLTVLIILTCEHMILGQLRMGARQAKNAPLILPIQNHPNRATSVCEVLQN